LRIDGAPREQVRFHEHAVFVVFANPRDSPSAGALDDRRETADVRVSALGG
jgi:hypothetical protein